MSLRAQRSNLPGLGLRLLRRCARRNDITVIWEATLRSPWPLWFYGLISGLWIVVERVGLYAPLARREGLCHESAASMLGTGPTAETTMIPRETITEPATAGLTAVSQRATPGIIPNRCLAPSGCEEALYPNGRRLLCSGPPYEAGDPIVLRSMLHRKSRGRQRGFLPRRFPLSKVPSGWGQENDLSVPTSIRAVQRRKHRKGV
jgi:hypothetical protein